MTEESSSPGGWVSIGHLTGEMPWKTYSANASTVYFRPLATPGEIECCTVCMRHVNGNCSCMKPRGELAHMQAIHALHTLPATGPGEVPPTKINQSRQE